MLADCVNGCIQSPLRCSPPSFQAFETGPRYLELIALRHQLLVLERNRTTRPRLNRFDQYIRVWLYHLRPGCLDGVVMVKPDTVIVGTDEAFGRFVLENPGRDDGTPACAPISAGVDPAIEPRKPAMGAPRIHGELLKLGIEICQATVSKVMVRHPRPPSRTWRTFLANHVDGLASIDLFVVPTASFRLLYAFIVPRHERRRPCCWDQTWGQFLQAGRRFFNFYLVA